EARKGGVHDARIAGPERRERDSEPLDAASLLVREHDVSVFDEVEEQRASRLVAQVDGDAALALLLVVEMPDGARRAAQGITDPGLLDLDDLRAEQAEQERRVVPGEVVLDREDAHAGERPLSHRRVAGMLAWLISTLLTRPPVRAVPATRRWPS